MIVVAVIAAVAVVAAVAAVALGTRSVDWQRILGGLLPGWPWW
jgi:hypothetical protein